MLGNNMPSSARIRIHISDNFVSPVQAIEKNEKLLHVATSKYNMPFPLRLKYNLVLLGLTSDDVNWFIGTIGLGHSHMLFLNVGVGSLCFRRLVGVGRIAGTLIGRRDGAGPISSNWGSAFGYAATTVASARATIEKRMMEYSM